MKIYMNCKPKVVTNAHKHIIIRQFTDGVINHDEDIGIFYFNKDKTKVIAINLEKTDSITSREIIKKGKNKGKVKTNLTPAQWTGYIYEFDINDLKQANLKVDQKTCNFRLIMM